MRILNEKYDSGNYLELIISVFKDLMTFGKFRNILPKIFINLTRISGKMKLLIDVP